MVCFPMIFLDCQGRWQGETRPISYPDGPGMRLLAVEV